MGSPIKICGKTFKSYELKYVQSKQNNQTNRDQYFIIIEKRIYIRGEFKESLGMNFFSPFQPEMEFKVYKSCKCSTIICSRVH